jgi:hypothetical protein
MVLMAILNLGFVGGLVGSTGPADRAVSSHTILGTAEGRIWETQLRHPDDPQVHNDTPAMIKRLQALHANTYQFPIEYQTDWQDLSTEFMPAAQRAGITVIAYLMPPSECPSSAAAPESCDEYVPFHADYVAWGAAIARLSAEYPDLRAWTVDDMDYNLGLFTPSYVAAMNAAASAIQPHLDLYLELYRPSITKAVIDAYAHTFDGLIMPYRDGANSDTAMTDTLQAEIDEVSSILAGSGTKFIVMVYGNTLGKTMVSPDVDYISRAVDIAMANIRTGKVNGVIVWNLELGSTGEPAGGTRNLARTGVGALSLSLAPNTATARGQYAQAASTIHLNGGSSSCVLQFWSRNDQAAGAIPGYHAIQVYVGSRLIWQQDMASQGSEWSASPQLTVTPDLVNGMASVSVRLTELAEVSSFAVNAIFDDFSSTGCSVWNPGFETDNGWTLTRSAGALVPAVYQYNPSFTTAAFSAVAVRFRP